MTVLDWFSEKGQRNAQEASYIISGCLQTLTRLAKDPLVSVSRAPGKETLTYTFHVGAVLNLGVVNTHLLIPGTHTAPKAYLNCLLNLGAFLKLMEEG